MSIVYPQPIQSFRFLIQAGGIAAAFTSFSGVKMSVETVQTRDGDDSRGVQDYVPVLTRFDPVTLSRGVVGDNDFMDWIFAAAADMESGPTGSNLRRDIDVITLNDAGQPAVTWTLKGAMPIGYEMAPLDSSRSEVLMESITFAITGMRRTAMEPGEALPAWQGKPTGSYQPRDPWRMRGTIRPYTPRPAWKPKRKNKNKW